MKIKIYYETEYLRGTFELLGICREGGARLLNPDQCSRRKSNHYLRKNPKPQKKLFRIYVGDLTAGTYILMQQIPSIVKTKRLDII